MRLNSRVLELIPRNHKYVVTETIMTSFAKLTYMLCMTVSDKYGDFGTLTYIQGGSNMTGTICV